eukprot:gene47004-63679_t
MLIFSRISTRQSTCWVLNDQLRIHSLIESSVGFEAVDKIVHEAIAKALHPAEGNGEYSKAAAITPERRPQDPFVIPIRRGKATVLVKLLQDNDLIEGNRVPERVDNYECTVFFK